jgi:hypothetical protein
MDKLQVPKWFREHQRRFTIFRQTWEQTYSEPFPLTIEEWQRWLARADIPDKYFPAKRIAAGKWTMDDILPFVEGYLLKLRDIAKLNETKHTADDPEEMVSPATVAKRFGLTDKQIDRLRKSLAAWRSPANYREWTEIPDRKPRQSPYLYRLGSIQHLIDSAKSAG